MINCGRLFKKLKIYLSLMKKIYDELSDFTSLLLKYFRTEDTLKKEDYFGKYKK